MKKTKPRTAKELMWHRLGEHHSTTTPLPSHVFREELKVVKPKKRKTVNHSSLEITPTQLMDDEELSQQ